MQYGYISIGADKPGVEKFSMDYSTEDPESLANALRPHYVACSESRRAGMRLLCRSQ